MTLLFSIIIFLAMVVPSFAGAAASCSQADVQTAVTAAARGETVTIPACSVTTWNSPVIVTKAITIQGAGSGSTYIKSNIAQTSSGQWMIKFQPSAIASDTNVMFRVTGINFDLDYKTGAVFVGQVQSGAWGSTTPLNKVRIDNNIFQNCRYQYPAISPLTNASWDKVILTMGAVYGVVDSNTFSGGVSMASMGTYSDAGRAMWDDVTFSHGNAESMYYEDNTINYTENTNGVPDQIWSAGWGGRYVARYNDINITYNDWKCVWDIHGGYDYYANYGSRGVELYGNKITRTTGSPFTRLAHVRGGKNLVFYNKIITSGSANVRLDEEYKDGLKDTVCPTGTLYSGYYCSIDDQPEHVRNTYIFKNYYGNTVMPYETGGWPSPALSLRRNTDFWVDSNIGCGTALQMAAISTCTNGAGYWVPSATIDPTAASCTNLTDYVGKNNAKASQVSGKSGTLFTCQSNEWVYKYEPYTYPHILRSQPVESSPPVLSGTPSPSGAQPCPDDPSDIPVSFTVTDQNTVTCYSCEDGVGTCSSSSTYAQIAAMAGKTTYTSTQSGQSHTQTANISSACNTSAIQHWARCSDSLGNVMTTSIGISYSTESADDSDVPTMTAASIDTTGTMLNLTFSEPVQIGTGGSAGWTLSRTRSGTPANVDVTYASGAGTNTLVYSLASTILSTDSSVTVVYTQPGSGITDFGGTPVYCGSSPDATRNANLLCEAPDGTSDGLAGWTIQRSKRYPTADPDAGNVVSFTNACDETASLGCADIGTTNCIRVTKAQYQKDEDVYAFKKLTDTDITGDIYLQFYFKNMGQPTDSTGCVCTPSDEDCQSYTCTGETNMTDGHDVEVIGFTPGAKVTYGALPADYPANVYIGLHRRGGNYTLSTFHYTTENHHIYGTESVAVDGSKWIGVRLHVYNSATAGEDYYEMWADWAGDGVTWTKIGDTRVGYYDDAPTWQAGATNPITFQHPFRYIYIGQNDLEGKVDFQITGIKLNTTGFPSDCTRSDTSANELATIGSPEAVTNNSVIGSTATQSLFDHTATLTGYDLMTDVTDFNAGVKWQSAATGTVTGICFYKDATMTGTHIGYLYHGATLLGQVTFSGESASGWQCQNFASGINISKDTVYTASVYIPTNWMRTANFFQNTYTNGGNLSASSDNGYWVFSTAGVGLLPTNPSASKSNYWTDVLVSYAGVSGPWEVTITNASDSAAKCTIDKTVAVVDDTGTATITTTVASGWRALMTGCGGTSTLSGNTYTFVTGSVVADCTVTVTCSEKQVVPWLAP